MDFLNFDLNDNLLFLSRSPSLRMDTSPFQQDSTEALKESFDSTFFNSQTNPTNNYSSSIVDYSTSHQCTCNCRQYQMMTPDFGTMLSLNNSTNSRGGFRLHKDASEEDAKELFLALAPETVRQQADSLDKLEAQSRSTEADNNCQTTCQKPSLVDVAIDMVENHQLTVVKFGDLSEFDKHFLANIIYIKNKVSIDLSLSPEDFVQQVNSNIGEVKEKRIDDRLRFVYKRAIKHLLAKRSNYTVNKLHKMEDFKDPMIKFYFPRNPEITGEIMDTSFASRKKMLKFFKLSPLFKQDFMEFAKSELKPIYDRYARDTYQSMYKRLVVRYKRKNCNKTSNDILLKAFKRLPWRCADIQGIVDQIALLNLL